MTYKTTKLIAAFLLWIGLSALQAQETVLSSSGNAAGNGGSVSYSVGQVAFVTKTGSGGTVTEGVQQPYEILFMNGIDPEVGINLECLVYPNPANTHVRLKFENHDILNTSYQLKSMNGFLLRNSRIVSNETVIPMDDLVPATYVLTVFRNEKVLQSYKIIKK